MRKLPSRRCMIHYLHLLIIIFSCPAKSAEEVLITQRVILNANVVSSACHVKVQADSMNNNRLTMDAYKKGDSSKIHPKSFYIWVFEDGATLPGCSAFLVGNFVSVHFGNPGQLDEIGVVTRGAGDKIRIEIKSTDNLADYREKITNKRAIVNYPTNFASEGKLSFIAKPVNLEASKSGEYMGALSFVVTYQ
ncbi:MAG: fimbrial protein [Acinetobacter sp.]